jgi:hypothetical protein
MSSRRPRYWFTASLLWLCFLAVPSFAASQYAISSDTLPLLSDFDGDQKLDQAQLFSNGAQKSIQVSLGNFSSKSLYFDSGVQDRGRLVSDDIDSDGDTDLVWISQSHPRQFVMWLGDGRGNFAIATGHDRYLPHPLLDGTERTRLAENAGGDDSPCVICFAPLIAATFDASFSHDVVSQRRVLPFDSATISNTYFSDLRQRGPPSLRS